MSAAPTPQTLIFDVTNAKQPVLLNRHQDPSVDPTVATFPHDAMAQGTASTSATGAPACSSST